MAEAAARYCSGAAGDAEGRGTHQELSWFPLPQD